MNAEMKYVSTNTLAHANVHTAPYGKLDSWPVGMETVDVVWKMAFFQFVMVIRRIVNKKNGRNEIYTEFHWEY